MAKVTTFPGGTVTVREIAVDCPRCQTEWMVRVEIIDEPRTLDYPGWHDVRILAHRACPRCGRALSHHDLLED